MKKAKEHVNKSYRYRRNHWVPGILSLIYLCLPSPLLALSTDRNQPIEVEADSLEIRGEENISIYTGNVRLDQGSLVLRADRLVINFNDQNELTLMELNGSPATFRQLNNENQEMIGQADRLEYRETESTLILLGNARFSHKGDTIESNTIHINTENESIQAGSSSSDERVKMLIQPKQQ